MFFRISLIILVFSFVSVSQAVTEAEKQQHEQNLKECMGEFSKITEEMLKNLDKKDFKTEDKDIFCFTKCIGNKNGVLDDKGVINVEKMMEIHKDKDSAFIEKLKAGYEKCVQITGTDPCDTAWKQWRCLGNEFELYH